MPLTLTISDSHFDSELIVSNRNATTNADLIITLRVRFTPNPPGPVRDADGDTFQAVSWKPGEFEIFKKKAQEQVTSIWNERLWLRTPDTFLELDWPNRIPLLPTHRPNIHCGFRFNEILTPGNIGPHATISVAKLEKPYLERLEEKSKRFRSNSTQWCHLDVQNLDPGVPKVTGNQIVAAHEAGHLIGQQHVGVTLRTPACVSPPKDFFGNSVFNSDAPACYTAGSSTSNIMGVGNTIENFNAISWQERMALHTGKATKASEWQAATTRFAPREI